MPKRFVISKWSIRVVYVIILFSLLGLMTTTYFVDDFLIFRSFGLNFNLSYLPFIFIAVLYGYFLALNAYLILFVSALFINPVDSYLLTPYMIVLFLFSMFSQYRWFRTKKKTFYAFLISYFNCILFEFLNQDMLISYNFDSRRLRFIMDHISTPVYSYLIGCIFFYLFFNHAPDFIKKIFPLGYIYTREYVENLLFQNSMKKTRLSIKITFIIIVEAVILEAFAIIFIKILFPDLRGMMNEGLRHAEKIGQDMVFRYNNYGLAFTIKMLFMELSIAVPIASNINFYAKTRIGTPIGLLSSLMLKFTDTTDENRTEYLQTIKEHPINTHDEITDLYYSMMITLNEVTGYIEHMKEEQKLKENLRIAEAASEAKSSFLSNMSHEIRTPINAVLGMNEMILRESSEPQILEYSNTIMSAGNTLLSLVNDILDFSKIEAGKMEILPVQYNLSSVINDLVNMIIHKAQEKKLDFKVIVDENIPDLLYGDEIRIKQCVTNILTNAVKYTEKGEVRLEVGYEVLERDERAGDGAASSDSNSFLGAIALTFRVVDTGIGIKEEDLQKLYSPFERIEEIRNRSIEGTGLGMSIVKKLLALMDTRLVVKSVYGEGSDFSFTVQQRVCNFEPIGDFEKRYKQLVSARAEYHEAFTAPDARILVVDDTRMNLTVIKGLLKRTLIQIETAESGQEALQMVTSEKYDLIFLDHRMPQMDGIETLAAMRKLEDNLNSDTLCIALTANAVAGAREFYLEAGFADYISKPVDPSRLENMLMTYLPKEKVVPQSGKSADASSELSSAKSPLFSYRGIDAAAAIENCGGEDIALEALEDFKANLPEKKHLIKEYLDSTDIRNFTIQVHSLKSSARIIGAAELSRRAAELEELGNKWCDESALVEDSASSAVVSNTLLAIREKALLLLGMIDDYFGYLGIHEDTSNAATNGTLGNQDFNSADTSEISSEIGMTSFSNASPKINSASLVDTSAKDMISSEDLLSAFSNIKELMEAFDYDNASAIYKMLADYTIPSEFAEKYKLVGKYLAAVDREKLLEIL